MFRLFIVVFFFSFPIKSEAQIIKEKTIRLESNQTIKKMDTPSPDDYKGDLCVPEYTSGCGMGDGFTDFAVEEIQNYSSGCDDNMGYDGWSQYLDLGPAFLLPGQTYDFIMQTGYDDQYVTIWIDFNDDYALSNDEKIISDFVMDESGQLYTVSINIPLEATMGQHFMRARTNWQNSCSDPCENYSYGEAEDYYVMVGEASFGIIEGTVTEMAGGNPVEGATISVEGLLNYTLTTGSDGTYFKDQIMVGDYDVECFKEGFNVINTTITIEEDVVLTQDFQLTQPNIDVNPLSLGVELEPNGVTEETILVENNGNGPLDWSASMFILNSDSKDFLDLQFEYTAIGGFGEAGIESDGQYIYTTKWNSNEFLQYELDGTYIGSFTISGVSTIRDLAYDGNYFYGGNASTTVYEMDFETHTLVSIITAPTNVRALAYNENEDVFYGNNWNSNIVKFDKAGNNLGEFETGPEGSNYYGFAYDPASLGGPYLWGYAQTGNSQNQVVQMQLPSGTETGLSFDITEKLSGQVWGAAGGLFAQPNLVYGKWTLGGIVQNERLWGLELADAQTWLGISPNGGTLALGESEELTVVFDATGVLPGVYEAEIHFTTYPEVGTPVVDVTMIIEGIPIPCNIQTELNCTNIDLTWEMCPSGAPDPDSYNVYRNDVFVANVDEMLYTDSLLYPDSLYGYKISALFGEDETFPVPAEEVTIPFPENLEPANLNYTINGNMATISWNTPTACVSPSGYNLYMDMALLGFTTDTSFQTGVFNNTVFIVEALYYFGGLASTIDIIITEIADISSVEIVIYPNPVKDNLFIQSPYNINRIELLNNIGVAVFENVSKQNTFQLNVSFLSSGIYFLKIETEHGLVLRKILVK